eukprot:COSAG01_NODE_57490_length_312_cov_0.488263_1_plen_64_part_01
MQLLWGVPDGAYWASLVRVVNLPRQFLLVAFVVGPTLEAFNVLFQAHLFFKQKTAYEIMSGDWS